MGDTQTLQDLSKQPEQPPVSGGMTVNQDQTLIEFLDSGWENYGISVLDRLKNNTAVVAVNGTIVHVFGPLGKPIDVVAGDDVYILGVIAGG